MTRFEKLLIALIAIQGVNIILVAIKILLSLGVI